MSSTKKVIVVSNAFLLTSGIEKLVLELSGMLVDQVFYGSEKKLSDKIISKKPEFVIIDPDAVSDILIPLLRELNEEKDIKIIGLVSSTSSRKIISRFSFTLNVEKSKYQLVEAFQKIVGKEEKKKSNNDQLLSKREKEILQHLAMGLTNQEIANKFFLSVHTIMTHRKKITRKLGIKTLSGLTVYALINNLVDMREVERRV
ncbi:MAG: response regulator transcription factor [Bacteroidetes bacterium]|nr:response regulator transcription factor [Bacteroidota bacterium]MBL6943437.1 response regulator transcription factor [Bacteroidales bacterium]